MSEPCKSICPLCVHVRVGRNMFRVCSASARPLSAFAGCRGVARTFCATTGSTAAEIAPWARPMPDTQLDRLRAIVEAPSPVGLEGAMTHGVLAPMFRSFMPPTWQLRTFQGSASIVVDTMPDVAPEDCFTLMVVGHADKIRMQVRSIGSDGKIYINSDSFLPLTLLGNEVTLFSEDPEQPGEGRYRRVEGGTVEALGAIHFAPANVRTGAKGVKAEQLYLELGFHGSPAERKAQASALGIRPGDPLLLHRPLRRGFAQDTVVSPYLDNGAGCFVAAELGRLLAEGASVPGSTHVGGSGGSSGAADAALPVRVLLTIASHEEIGRFGSRVLASEMRPDALIAVDVNHDYDAAPGIGDRRMPPLRMGSGCTLSVGAIASERLNALLERAAHAAGVPIQRDCVGRDTGTDAMAAVLGGIDCAATSVGFPIRNMHTVSELAHTGDLLAATHALLALVRELEAGGGGATRDFLRSAAAHPDLGQSSELTAADAAKLVAEQEGEQE